MFDYLYAEAYAILRNEIEAIAKELSSDDNYDNALYNLYYAGQLIAINRVIRCMNKVQTALDESIDEEPKCIEREEKENV